MDTFEERTHACQRALEARCREAGAVISGDGRVSEAIAAELLALAPGTLRNMRAAGEGPRFFRTPVNGCRVSYRLFDVASWIEVGRA